MVKHLSQPHLQIRHRRPHIPLGPFRDLAGDGDGGGPPPGEELRENLVFRWLEADQLEPGLEAFGEAADLEVGGAEERVARWHPVEVGEEHVLGILRAAVEFVHHFHRPRTEQAAVGEAARPFPRQIQPHFTAVDVLDGGGMDGERAGDQVGQAGLADAGRAGDEQLERLVRGGSEPLGLFQ